MCVLNTLMILVSISCSSEVYTPVLAIESLLLGIIAVFYRSLTGTP